jgi:hypothetical protein
MKAMVSESVSAAVQGRESASLSSRLVIKPRGGCDTLIAARYINFNKHRSPNSAPISQYQPRAAATMANLSPLTRSSIPSPLTTQLPNLSPTEIAALPYPPDVYPGGRDVKTPYGNMRVYEWGPEDGRKVMLVHGDATCAPLWKRVAEGLIEKGCRIIVIGESIADILTFLSSYSWETTWKPRPPRPYLPNAFNLLPFTGASSVDREEID